VTRSDVAGWFFVASFALWLPAAALPARIWTAPLPERLALIRQRPGRWQLVNLSIAAAAVLLALGFVALRAPLEEAGGGVIVELSLAVLLVGLTLWLASLVFRITVTTAASMGEQPVGFATASAWAGGLFIGWSVLANVAVIGLGTAIVESGYPASWPGWTSIALAAAMLAQLAATRDALPALYHVGPLLVGLALLAD
jgi:hypothetical protein